MNDIPIAVASSRCLHNCHRNDGIVWMSVILLIVYWIIWIDIQASMSQHFLNGKGWYLVRQIQLTPMWCTSPHTVQHIHHRISWRACRSRARLSLSNPLCLSIVFAYRRFKTAHGKRALTIELCARLYLHMYGVVSVHLQKSHLCAPLNSVMGCCCFLRVRFTMLSARIGDVVFGISCMQCKCNFMGYSRLYVYTVIFCLGRDYILFYMTTNAPAMLSTGINGTFKHDIYGIDLRRYVVFAQKDWFWFILVSSVGYSVVLSVLEITTRRIQLVLDQSSIFRCLPTSYNIVETKKRKPNLSQVLTTSWCELLTARCAIK